MASNTANTIDGAQAPLGVHDVAEVLYPQYAIITGGKSRDGCPLITFPDQTNFQALRDEDYQRLMLYLTSVPSLQEVDMGFHLVIDRRKDKWTSVKTVLLKISVYFPGLIHVVYVIRPVNIFQKAISEVSNKLFKDEFKFRMIVLSTLEELHELVEVNQLTPDLGGTLQYVHHEWIQHRVDLEKFSNKTREISNALDDFTKTVHETEFPNDVSATRSLLDRQDRAYMDLKEDILAATKYGESLLYGIREKSATSALNQALINQTQSTTTTTANTISTSNTNNSSSSNSSNADTIGTVFAIERLLVQLEETERTFETFWRDHSQQLLYCLELRTFEQEFRELQSTCDVHLKVIAEMTDIGDSVSGTDSLIADTVLFTELCAPDVERVHVALVTGERLLGVRSSWAQQECVAPKCEELRRMRDVLLDRIAKRSETLHKCRHLMEQIDKANQWCSRGLSLLASQDSIPPPPHHHHHHHHHSGGVEKALHAASVERAECSLREIAEFLTSARDLFNIAQPRDFQHVYQEWITSETKPLVTQVVHRIEDVFGMCEKKCDTLRRVTVKPVRPVQPVMPEPVVSGPIIGAVIPMQQKQQQQQPHRQSSVTVLATHPMKPFKKALSMKMESTGSNISSISEDSSLIENDIFQDEIRHAKQGHVLAELLETERIYVAEMLAIIVGYKEIALSEEMQSRLPAGLLENIDTLFGNLDEIYNFHADVFLKDLENCITSTDLVALCFVQKRDIFFRLYSYYCQNIPRSEQLRETLVDHHQFFQTCQRKLDHKLPLAAYLLKPVQRITKYQLLLKDLLRYTTTTATATADSGGATCELQQALDCMLLVLKCVNDSMLQISITGFPVDLQQQGELLLQGAFHVLAESKRDLRLRLKPKQRHLFLYQKMLLFCKPAAAGSLSSSSSSSGAGAGGDYHGKTMAARNTSTYHYKHYLQMSQIGLTESVRGDARKFEVWLQGRLEVHTIQAATVDQKQTWVNEIKRVLFNQLEELKGEKKKQYTSLANKHLRQTTTNATPSWETTTATPSHHRLLLRNNTTHHIESSAQQASCPQSAVPLHHPPQHQHQRAMSCDTTMMMISSPRMTTTVAATGGSHSHTLPATTTTSSSSSASIAASMATHSNTTMVGIQAGTAAATTGPTSCVVGGGGGGGDVTTTTTTTSDEPTDGITMEAAASWSSDCSNSDDDENHVGGGGGGAAATSSGRYVALADYCAVGSGEVSMWEGDLVELLKVGCAGWWFVKLLGSTNTEGWAPAAYLENAQRKSSQSSSRSQDGLNDIRLEKDEV